jgi:Leucine-rich repeat (LRR) protein
MILIVELHFIFQELILRDNKLTRIPDASIFKGLLVFDVSFNEISSLRGLSNVSSILKELYVSKNEVTKMEELDHFRALEILELGSNRLRVRIWVKYTLLLVFILKCLHVVDGELVPLASVLSHLWAHMLYEIMSFS